MTFEVKLLINFVATDPLVILTKFGQNPIKHVEEDALVSAGLPWSAGLSWSVLVCWSASLPNIPTVQKRSVCKVCSHVLSRLFIDASYVHTALYDTF